MIYLALPYSTPDLTMKNWRYQRAREALFSLWEQGYPTICPIILGHEYEQRQRSGPKEMPHDFWMMMARAQLVSCTYIYVLTLKGWDESDGVRQEVVLASQMNKSVMGYSPFSSCEEVSGRQILMTFGIPEQARPKPLILLRTNLALNKDGEEGDL